MLLTQIKHGLTSSFKQKVMSILDGSKKHASRYNQNDRLYYHNIINNVDVRIKLFIQEENNHIKHSALYHKMQHRSRFCYLFFCLSIKYQKISLQVMMLCFTIPQVAHWSIFFCFAKTVFFINTSLTVKLCYVFPAKNKRIIKRSLSQDTMQTKI